MTSETMSICMGAIPPARLTSGRRIERMPAARPIGKSGIVSSSGGQFAAPHLARRPANFSALTPLAFLPRAARAHPDKIAVVDGPVRRNYRQFYERCRRFADALRRRGIGERDTVAVLAPNVGAL